MKKTLSAMLVLLLLLLSGCQSKPLDEDINKVPQENSKRINESTRSDIRALYFHGNYNEELYELQQRNIEEGKIYFHLIKDRKHLQDTMTKYNLVGESEDGNYNPTQEFFKDSLIIALYPGQVSSSVHYVVTDVNEKGAWNIEIEKNMPELQSDDIINCVIFIEMKKDTFERWQKVTVNIKENK